MPNEPTAACPKCSSTMELGFVVDKTHTGYLPSTWVEGRPKRSFWTGIKISEKKQRLVDSYRCTKCGFLESYAIRQH